MPVLGDHNRASHHPHVGPRPPGRSQPAAHLGPHEEPEFRSSASASKAGDDPAPTAPSSQS